jgi:D-alanyl-D-alanine carboxypeptidase
MYSALKHTLTVAVVTVLLTAQLTARGTSSMAQGTGAGDSVAPIDRPPDGRSSEEIARELGAFLDELTASDSFAGAVLVAKNEKPIFRKAYGLANKDSRVQNQATTKFNLGSMNKMFTAVAIAQLAQQGKLSFDDPVGKYLPDYPNKAVADKVTIHHLLTHTSGMGDYLNEKFMTGQASLKTVTDYLPIFANDPLAFEPGASWQYSNAGFILLGAIMERVTGESYYDYVREHVFEPAGMNQTGFYPLAGDLPGSATPYTNSSPNGPLPGPRHAAPREELRGGPAGGGYSTLDDMLKFSIALCRHKLLNPKYTDIVTTGKVKAPFGKYAYGFGDVNMNGVRSFGHNGGGPGIAAQLDIYPDLGYTVVVLSNYDAPAMFKVLSKIRALLNGQRSQGGARDRRLSEESQINCRGERHHCCVASGLV